MRTRNTGESPLKAELASAVAAILEDRELTPASAAQLLGLAERQLAALVRGQLRGISEGQLLECLVRLGQDVHIVVNEKPLSREAAQVSVLVMRPSAKPRPGVKEPVLLRDPKSWEAMTGSQKKAYAAVLRAQAKQQFAPPMDAEEVQLLLLELAPMEQPH